MAKKPSLTSAKGRTIMLPESFREDMDRLKKELGIKSDSEVIRRAYRLLKKIGGPELRAKLEREERKIKRQASARRKKRKAHAPRSK